MPHLDAQSTSHSILLSSANPSHVLKDFSVVSYEADRYQMRLYTSPPPYVNRSSETNPLVPGKASRRRSCSRDQYIWTTFIAILAMAIAFALYASVFPLSSCNNPLDPDVRDRIRKEWDIERRGNLARRVQWDIECQENLARRSYTCTMYGTREYTARLVNIPGDYNRHVEACMATPIQIHGIEYKAKWCEDHGPRNVTGHWEVNQHEPDCASYWNQYKDLGCASPGSGQRRIEHHLENIPHGGDWREFCATTPANFLEMQFMGSESCFHTTWGTYGLWVIDDESCN
ncbi:hypothetical protein M405DRAFT_843471 [Rhizopogon salebrosus TDB-379]|nr:hypothetical protein M405DRAFT_843471 [Rhizopogon salebrosus TDB-379]